MQPIFTLRRSQFLDACRTLVLCLTFLSVLPSHTHAQSLPATVTTTIGQPASVYYSDYFAPGSDKLKATVVFNDFNEPSWSLRLRITVESNNLRIGTRPDFVPPQPITVVPGVPLQLSGSDLAPYLDVRNVQFSGYSQADLNANNGKLPEGVYSFCVELLDYRSGKVLANKSCATSFLFLNDEPTTINPVCGNIVRPNLPQNIFFQWQQSNISSPNSSGTDYKLFLYEVTDPSVNPAFAITNGKALKIFESDLISNRTNFLYDVNAPILDKGKRYVYQVRAMDRDGRDVFKNKGFSQVCWFSYGYPTNGLVSLVSPEQDGAFGVLDRPFFKFKAPDNTLAGQQFTYRLKIVKLNAGQKAEEAIAHNAAWYEETTMSTGSTADQSLFLTQKLDRQTDYAWQVVAFSEEQEIAKSEVRTFHGPGIVEKFNAGRHVVYVSSTSNTDLTKLSGRGKVRISPDSTFQEVNFKDIHLIGSDQLWVLENGEINQELTNFPRIELTPNNDVNGVAHFYPTLLKLNKERLALGGRIQWSFPHAVLSDSVPFVKTAYTVINFNELKLNGNAFLDESNDFNLLDPLNFRLKLLSTSDINVIDNTFYLRFNGQLYLPENVKGVTGKRVFVPFTQADQLYYIAQKDLQLENNIQLLKNTGISLVPRNVFFDLSESESPIKFADQTEWKGVYFENYDLLYRQAVDNSKQLILNKELRQPYTLESYDELRSWVTSAGLSCYINQEYDTTRAAKFNQFDGSLLSIEMDFENSVLSKGTVKGQITIPLISPTYQYEYTLPLDNEGFKEGYLDEELAGSSFPFNLGGGEQELTIYIKRAVFADQERLDMVIDVDWPATNTTITALSGFKIWGNRLIGFNTPDGIINLPTKIRGDMESYPLMVDAIGCGFFEGSYVFNTNATIVMADDMAGKDGPTTVDFYSAYEAPFSKDLAKAAELSKKSVGLDNGRSAGGPSHQASASFIDAQQPSVFAAEKEQWMQSVKRPTFSGGGTIVPKGVASGKTEFVDSVYVKIDAVALAFEGKLKRTTNDPLWGTSFQGFLNFSIRIPGDFALDGIFINGRTNDKRDASQGIVAEGYGYWFAQLGFSMGDQLTSDFVNPPTTSGDATKYSKTALNDTTGYRSSQAQKDLDDANTKLANGPDQSTVDTEKTAATDLDKDAKEEERKANDAEEAARTENEEAKKVEKAAADDEKDARQKEAESKRKELAVTNKEKEVLVKENELKAKEKLAEDAETDYEAKRKAAEKDKKEADADPTNNAKKRKAEQSEKLRQQTEEKAKQAREGADKAKEAADKAKNHPMDGLEKRKEDAKKAKEDAKKARDKAFDAKNDAIKGSVKARKDANDKAEEARKAREKAKESRKTSNKKQKEADKLAKQRKTNEERVTKATERKQAEDAKIKQTKDARKAADKDPRGQAGAGGTAKKIGAKLEAGIPIPPLYFAITGIQGRIYHKMNHQSAGIVVGSSDPNNFDYIPDAETDFGMYLKLAIQDLGTNGKTWKAFGALEAAGGKSQGNFGIEAKVQIGNLDPKKPIGSGSALITFNSKQKHFVARGHVDIRTFLCAEGSFLIDMQPGLYRVALGTKQDKITVGPCFGWGGTGYIDFNQDSVALAVGVLFRAELASPYFGSDGLKARVRAGLGAAAGISAVLQYKPFYLNEVGVWLDAWAYLNVDYETFIKSGTFEVLSARLQGDIIFRIPKPASVRGEMSGEVTILGMGCSFKANFKNNL